MTGLLKQTAAVIRINLKSLPSRAMMSLATTGSIALVVMVLCGFLALSQGFRTILAATADPTTIIVLSDRSSAELTSAITRGQASLIDLKVADIIDPARAQISPELFVNVSGTRRSDGETITLPLRGLSSSGLALRPEVRLSQGRPYKPGERELYVGASVQREFKGYDLGDTVRLGATEWRVVGIFQAPGSVHQSEIYADAEVVQSVFDRQESWQSLRIRLDTTEQTAALISALNSDQRLGLSAETTTAFYARQARGTGDLIRYLAWPLAVIMAIGALAGAANTMQASVTARQQDIAVLRALGFPRFSAFAGTVAESLFLSGVGAILGIAASFAVFDGVTTSTIGAATNQVVFDMEISAGVALAGGALALAVGGLAALVPAVRSARMSASLALNA